jgi:ribosome biogenesis GTPase
MVIAVGFPLAAAGARSTGGFLIAPPRPDGNDLPRRAATESAGTVHGNMDLTLGEFGWNGFFQAQLDGDEPQTGRLARVMAVHRDRIDVAGPGIEARIRPFHGDPGAEEDAATIGDWLVVGESGERAVRRLARSSLIKRRAAGRERRVQLIAANVDTLFIVTSCNQDFNPARLERYLALAQASGVMAVVVLTKADLADDPAHYGAEARALMPGLLVETIDARDREDVAALAPWVGRGQTVALVGSSGVGKSTILNALVGGEVQKTREAREDDDRGRHTTAVRSLHRLPTGGWLADMPGMREVRLTNVREGVEDVFADIAALAASCRFSDCRHRDEPGCAVRAAIEAGALDPDQLDRYLKLAAEDRHNSETIAGRRARERAFGRTVRQASQERQRRGKE